MATFLDVSILEGAGSIFGFLLIFTLTYGVLKFSNLFKNSDGLNSIVAVSMAFISLFSPGIMEVIKVITPWFTLFMFFIIMILVIVTIFGGLGSGIGDIKENMGAYYKVVVTWIVVISVIIFLSGVSTVFLGGSSSTNSVNSDDGQHYISSAENGSYQNSLPAGSDDGLGADAFVNNLFHPKMLGAILFLLLAGISVLLLGYSSVKA